MDLGPHHTWTGSRYIDVSDPRPEDMSLSEIATGLSREQRFGAAATCMFWSVAQHSLLVVRLMRDDGVTARGLLACGLMHDAPEFVLRDIIRPVKGLLTGYDNLEGRFWRAIADRFLLPDDLADEVKHYDDLALAVEKRVLVSPKAGVWPGLPDPGGRKIPPELLALAPDEARVEFLAEARNIGVSERPVVTPARSGGSAEHEGDAR